jgi:hypothetical protein
MNSEEGGSVEDQVTVTGPTGATEVLTVPLDSALSANVYSFSSMTYGTSRQTAVSREI